MTQDPNTAVTHGPRRRRISPVWFIPLGAALIGLWLIYQNVMSRGPEITLALDPRTPSERTANV